MPKLRRLIIAAPLSFLLLSLSPAGAQDLSDEVKDLTFVGFQQYREASRVFVRTNEAVRYRVESPRDGVVVLTLENTGNTTANNLRHLDATYFDSPVRFIQPKLIEGTSPSIEVEIRLDSMVPYEALQNDNFLALDFKRQ